VRTPRGACSTRSRRCARTPYLPERTESPGRLNRPGLSHAVYDQLTNGRGTLKLVLRQARFDLLDFLPNQEARFMTPLGSEANSS
jgi:hypothetical protein